MTNNARLVRSYIGPLEYIDADERLAAIHGRTATPESVLEYLCAPGIASDVVTLIRRYREISNKQQSLFAVPHEEQILDKLVWPLRYAKGSYMVGNYLGAISLCGMVSEMIAILLFEISEIYVNGVQITEKKQKSIFGSTFEKLGQERRVTILYGYGLIDVSIKQSFDLIRTKRRRYLHLWSQDHDTLSRDAIDCFQAALKLVIYVLGQDIRDGIFILRPAFIKYLERKGLFSQSDKDHDSNAAKE